MADNNTTLREQSTMHTQENDMTLMKGLVETIRVTALTPLLTVCALFIGTVKIMAPEIKITFDIYGIILS
ncbi:MAG: hypothetical protein COW24_01295 [Candidatus Kerfeldbacteria bacterium CG15_BIG_FIL_POST_REV_8_21_14_020_45_12]|uniref:Uncharacterized protein n=1 Tax=Candidatus Kerfeldbacteria bacterium CG15_BIG_FIL_POST_REV_8_21_14_020_45_12 TaxID=2014247 RepID=A0A2M7H4S4_9BACT|nr:MAG: hypothetical protein COW24_01295 [Candidatus Kerfeldbacteria bacterium CG15_BIG_FIL_POST_REV_8_21_14_020_45_12]PJA93574.1 MAG: hypothetical protein CO132_02450 [Candidatus Kerfeldbacteria bacterium CG_4_9_14_3_um_filter_45_8]